MESQYKRVLVVDLIQINIKGIEKYATIVQREDLNYAVSLRSHGPIINDIATSYGGGGHPLAAGIDSITKEQVKELITKMTERR